MAAMMGCSTPVESRSCREIRRTGAANPLNGRDVGDEAKPAFGDLDGD
jgi:hypothetical protein